MIYAICEDCDGVTILMAETDLGVAEITRKWMRGNSGCKVYLVVQGHRLPQLEEDLQKHSQRIDPNV